MLCKDCKHCKTKPAGRCGSSRSYCGISSGSIDKGTRLGINLSSNRAHPKRPLNGKEVKIK